METDKPACRCQCHNPNRVSEAPMREGVCWWCAPRHGVKRWYAGPLFDPRGPLPPYDVS